MKPVFNDRQSELNADIRYIYVGKKFTDDAGNEWEIVYNDDTWGEHRWYFTGLLVVQSADKQFTWGHYFYNDKTESQEGQFRFDEYWFGDCDDFEWIPVVAKTVVTYEPAS